MSDSNPIGVFDSGVGGLSVLKHLVHLMPHEKFIYLGDTARVPYGNKSSETVQSYSKQCAEFLLKNNVKLIIIACNSASSVALPSVQSISDVPVVDVIKPSAIEAVKQTKNNRIGIIGTRATIGSNAYAHEIHSLSNDVQVFSEPCPLFVPFAEEGWISHPATRAIAEEYMKPLIKENIDTLILGCTHYPLLFDTIHDAISNAQLIDPGKFAAVKAMNLLTELNQLAPERDIPSTKIDYFVTDIPATFSNVAKQFLGFDVPKPTLVHIE